MESALGRLAEGASLSDLSIVYSDVHGLWGGVRVEVTAGGAFEQLVWERGSVAPTVLEATLAPAQVAELARLLLEIRAWEQQISDAQPLPDESRATLSIRCAGAESAIWERFNELTATGRITRVRDLMISAGATPAP
jgi:hypothetical protein